MSTGFNKDRIGAYIDKDPQSTLDYTVDWSSWINTADTLSTSTWAIETIAGDASPLASTSTALDTTNHLTHVWVTAGTAGDNYRITNTVTTVAGLTEERYFRIFVKDRTI
jgi:hypothetical protein